MVRPAGGRGRGGAQEEAAAKRTIDTLEGGKNLIYPTIHIKRVTIHSSVHQITSVSSQTIAFRRDLRIHSLRSTIRATDQKVKF
jgi:hypothetical protein